MANQHATRIIATLREQGVRITTARRAVIAALVASDGHVTAEDVTIAVQRQAPEIHLSTVYRTLESLEELGVVDHVHLGHGSAVYHLAENRHQHLVCERCKKVIHLADGLVDDLARVVDSNYHFTLRPHHFALIGLCEECRTDQ